MITKTREYTFSVSEEVKFFDNGKHMRGKIESIPNKCSQMDKVLVYASPLDSPSTLHSYRIELYRLKPFKSKQTP